MARALVFAGQGAQAVGMGKDLAEAYPACRALYDRADAVLGFGISRLCFEGPIEELTRSNNCQPAIFVTSAACLVALQQEAGELSPAGVAGLSLGEWTALYAAGALSFEDTLRILEARGRFMQEACEERQGGMVSVIGLPEEKLRMVCNETGVETANINSTEQVVLSGPKDAVARADKLATELGAKRTFILNVAGAFHSSLMASASAKLEAFLAGVNMSRARVPVVANVTGMPHGSPDQMKKEMVRQVTNSVRWLSCVEWFKGHGVSQYVELGPGKVLSGLIKRIDAGAATVGVQDAPSLAKTVESIRV